MIPNSVTSHVGCIFLLLLYPLTPAIYARTDGPSLLTVGGSCVVGTYTPENDWNCDSVIDNDVTSYSAPPGNGWIVISLSTIAVVTHVGILFNHPRSSNVDLHLSVLIGHEEKGIDIVYLPGGVYYLPFSLGRGVAYSSVTIIWRTSQLPDIMEIVLMGSQEGESIIPASTECDNFQESQCSYTVDGDILTSMYLASHTTLTITVNTNKVLTHVAFYSHQQQSESRNVTLILTVQGGGVILFQNDISYRNQGWKYPGQWQIAEIPQTTSPHRIADNISIQMKYGAFATLSEIQLFHIIPDNTGDLQSTLPSLESLPTGGADVYVMDIIHLDSPTVQPINQVTTAPNKRPGGLNGDIEYTTATPLDEDEDGDDMRSNSEEVLFSDGDTHRKPSGGHFATSSLSKDNTGGIILSTHSIIMPTGHHIQESADSTAAGLRDEEPTHPPVSTTLLPRWLWYVIVGVGVFIIVLIIALIIVITRMRHKEYRIPQRPQLVLRSQSTTSQAASLASPTRGFFHWTLNSQSSMPLPYSGVSSANTTTFGSKNNEADAREYIECNERNAKLSSQYSHAPSDDFELSDECFAP